MKRGFTLIELIGVITILGIISILGMSTINKYINESKQKNYNNQLNNIYSATDNWMVSNSSSLSKDIINCISIEELKLSEYLPNEKIYNPIDNNEINGYVIILFDKNNNQFIKRYSEVCE